MKCGLLRAMHESTIVPVRCKKTHLREVITGDNDDCSCRIQTTSPSASGHLRVFSRKNVPEATSIMFSDMREYNRFCRHIHSLEVCQWPFRN